jgi:hypothetical protein
MTEVLFIGGPYHGKVKNINGSALYHGLRYAEFTEPFQAEWIDPNDIGMQLTTHRTKCYIPQDIILFGKRFNIQVAEDYMVEKEFFLSNLIAKRLGFSSG